MAISPEIHPTARRVRELLAGAGLEVEVLTLDESTRSAAEAAAAIGCELGQIVKSLVFTTAQGPLVCLCAGDRRVEVALLPPGARQASADEVRAATGYAIGGVPPLGYPEPLPTLVDVSLRRFETVWAAAGTPRSVFGVATEALIAAIPDAEVTDLGGGS